MARFDPTRVIQLSWKPRAFLHKNFLTDAECEHMIELAKDKLEKSMVADNESGKSVASEIRTSSGMFLMKGQDDIISRIEDKIATWTFLPKENGEAIQVLRYQDGEKYEPHFDYFHDKNNQALGGHRIATVLMYLSDVIKGGETVFPSSEDRSCKRLIIVTEFQESCIVASYLIRTFDILRRFELRLLSCKLALPKYSEWQALHVNRLFYMFFEFAT